MDSDLGMSADTCLYEPRNNVDFNLERNAIAVAMSPETRRISASSHPIITLFSGLIPHDKHAGFGAHTAPQPPRFRAQFSLENYPDFV